MHPSIHLYPRRDHGGLEPIPVTSGERRGTPGTARQPNTEKPHLIWNFHFLWVYTIFVIAKGAQELTLMEQCQIKMHHFNDQTHLKITATFTVTPF